MPSPNLEQKMAIEHQGGVLLKAGAGSGKTFVLKEHMIYLAKNWIEEYKTTQSLEDFSSYIKSKFRKIVLMTFTKKAAGELAIRLENEFSGIVESDTENTEYWEEIVANLRYLQVNTIHGFCFYLIKMGFFPNTSGDSEILTESEYKDLILDIFNNYLENELEKTQDQEYIDLIINDKLNIYNAIVGIFADPTLRLAWKEASGEINKQNSNYAVDEILKIKGFNTKDFYNFDLNAFSEHEKKKWFLFAKSFQEQTNSFTSGLEGICQYFQFFQELDFKIPAKPSKVDPALISFYEKIRDFKDFLKKEGESFYLFKQEEEGKIKKWFSQISSLIKYVDQEYDKKEGLTFSDLEYIVYTGLESSKEVVERINNEFNYLIIDEFQDTSFIQYSIIQKIVKNDYSKLFCVGDLKQAIYGFRGGELGVFLDCEKNIPKNLSLKNNYRSDKEIINFNNELFDFLFKKGDKYTGVDKHAVEVEYQNFPEDKEEDGKVYCVETKLDFLERDEKLKTFEVDYVEALAIVGQIETLLKNNEEIAILYKKLKPSLFLIHMLIERNIGFTSQIKVPLVDDPIIGILKVLLEREFNINESAQKYQKMILETYLCILNGKKIEIDFSSSLEKFYSDTKYFGMYHALLTFLKSNGVSNSLYHQNLKFLQILINANLGDFESILTSLERQNNTSYSFDFCYGANSSLIKIMTAHASKGLQYKHVILGGIYTNENSMFQTAMLGKIPMSFKWSQTTSDKIKFKTPQFILENLLQKEKELSEQKRLFYVANTRAVSTLGWVEIDFSELKRTKSQPNSWASGLSMYFSTKEKIKNNTQMDIEKTFDQLFLDKSENEIPFFHVNSLGSEILKTKNNENLLTEISVTKLTTLEQCPRKFYFQNICKFSTEEMDLINDIALAPIEYENEELSSFSFSSSAQRGSKIHESLSEIIIDNFNQEKIDTLKGEFPHLDWTVDNLKKFIDKYEYISEKPIKFELFGYMISGIPDLIVSPKDEDSVLEIWDFKTGKISEEKLSPYFFQLYIYAYAQYIMGNVHASSPIKLVLCFVDEKENLEKTIQLNDVNKYLSEVFLNINRPDIKNTQNCEYCDYTSICEK